MPTPHDALVRHRAAGRCEYCHIPEVGMLQHVSDHIIAVQHGGTTTADNLAWSCGHCNSFKGPNIAGLDPQTGQLTRLFNPRTDNWSDHFRYSGPVLQGLTAIGRTTVRVLNMNLPRRVAVRAALVEGDQGQ